MIVGAIGALMLISTSVARAQQCECVDDVPDLSDRIQRANLVFEGTVTDARRQGERWIQRVRVVRVHAGYDLPEEVSVNAHDQRRDACGIGPLEVGARYLFIGSELSTLSVSRCAPPVSMQTVRERMRVEDVISQVTAPRAGCASCAASERGDATRGIESACVVGLVALALAAMRRRTGS